MKWPFIRRSKYEKMVKVYHQLHDISTKYIDHNRQLSNENDSLCQEIEKKDDIIAKLDALKNEYAQLNHDNLNEINRLNQELANELNSHRETKEQKNELSAECDRLYYEVDNLKEELQETKEHEQKLFEAHDKLNQQNMGLLFENEKLSKQNNQLILDKNHLKSKIKRLDSLLTKHKLELESAKSHVNWFYGNYARFKDMIEKSGYYKRV